MSSERGVAEANEDTERLERRYRRGLLRTVCFSSEATAVADNGNQAGSV